MTDILAFCIGDGRRVVQEQLGGVDAKVAYVATQQGLQRAATDDGITVIVTDLFDIEGRAVVPLLAELRRKRPSLKIVVSYEPSPATLDDLLEAAWWGAGLVFAARPFNNLGLLVPRLLLDRSTRAPSAAEELLKLVIPNAETATARRCLTLAAASPAHQLRLAEVAYYCGAPERTVARHVETIASAKVLLAALAWPQVSYCLTVLHWSPQEIASYFGYTQPGKLIDLLGDYVESGLWRWGLDHELDSVAAQVAAWSSEGNGGWFHHRRFRARPGSQVAVAEAASFEGETWSPQQRKQFGAVVLHKLSDGRSAMEIVRRLRRSSRADLGSLYRAVMEFIQNARSHGLIEER